MTHGWTLTPTSQRAAASPQPAQPVTGGAFHFDTDGRGQGTGYTWQIEHQGAFALAVVNLQAEQSISAEAGAMVSMSANIDLNSELKGGVFGALKRAVGGESAFVSTFTARGVPGEVTLAPGAPGDIAGIEMQNQMFMVRIKFVSGGGHRTCRGHKVRGDKIIFRRRRFVCTASFGPWSPARFIVRCDLPQVCVRASNMWSTPGIWSPGKAICNTTFVKRPRVVSSAAF